VIELNSSPFNPEIRPLDAQFQHRNNQFGVRGMGQRGTRNPWSAFMSQKMQF
jgi:hypothetical protein